MQRLNVGGREHGLLFGEVLVEVGHITFGFLFVYNETQTNVVNVRKHKQLNEQEQKTYNFWLERRLYLLCLERFPIDFPKEGMG